MAKKVRAIIKLQLEAGKATPAPPVGPALGQHGVNIMGFVKEYNSRTANQSGTIVPVHLTVFEDRSFTFVTRTPPASELLRKALDIEKGASDHRQGHVGTITPRSVEGNSGGQTGRLERCFSRWGDGHHRGHSPQHGHQGDRGIESRSIYPRGRENRE